MKRKKTKRKAKSMASSGKSIKLYQFRAKFKTKSF